ncbi:uncharacterized protein LOC143303421 [Bombus vancouverensis nearcticus]|uniref:uncharacterized protein LOC143303421 n=1 Tax=Bombus vancouverensis nearcticus TaxID=2705178 RepID=UPI00402B1BFD
MFKMSKYKCKLKFIITRVRKKFINRRRVDFVKFPRKNPYLLFRSIVCCRFNRFKRNERKRYESRGFAFQSYLTLIPLETYSKFKDGQFHWEDFSDALIKPIQN